MRIDKYLKIARIIKRRTVANEACDAGRVSANGKPVKASYEVKVGDEIEIGFGNRSVKIRVLAIKETVKKEEADSWFRSWFTESPKDPDCANYYGKILMDRGEMEKAGQLLQECMPEGRPAVERYINLYTCAEEFYRSIGEMSEQKKFAALLKEINIKCILSNDTAIIDYASYYLPFFLSLYIQTISLSYHVKF